MGTLNEIFSRHIEGVPPRREVAAIRRAAFIPTLRGIDDKKRTITFVASTEAVDRYGDILRVSGWDTKNYEKNPVFLWGHKSQDPPIGKTLAIHKETTPPALVHVVQFADAKTYPFADTIFNLYKGGYMKAVSVGFRPTAQPNHILDENGEWSGGVEYTSQELLELSAVPIPANPEAVARALNSGVITEDDIPRFFGDEDDAEAAKK
jgi:HK97 family phage prohead protease